MTTCSSCGTENAAGRRFCDECGAPLAVACPSCGAANRAGARFCGDCATPLVAGAGPATVAAPAAAPRRVAGAAATAERRLVSVLFADLVGFTSLAEDRDPEETRDLLSRYFEAAREIVDRYGGTVEKFIGDAVMAVWGTPVAHEDDAERAVRAGIELVDAVRGLGPGLEARAGVLTGETAVTLGATGQGMVAGDLVNTASRLQSVAPPGAVLVGEATMRAASGAIAFEAVGEQVLKGKASPVPAWRALRVVAQRRGAGRSELLEAPFVGRDEEFRLLRDLLHATGRERRTRLISITGPAGIGKSRLAWELEKYIDGVVEPIYWHRGRSPAYGEGITFWALGEMVRRRAGLAESDDERTSRTRIAETVAEYVPDPEDRRWVEPALLALLGLEPAPSGGRDVLFAAWRIFFERVALRGTTALVFEDLQWADSGLLDFIDHVLEWSRAVPILIVTLARPELFDRRPDWGAGKRNFTSLALEPLSAAAMRQLLGGLVSGLPEPAARAIVARADGIPLYAVETVRMLVADGRLEPVDGAYRPLGDLGELAVPETLRSLIASRLDALEPADRGLLQDASVLGQSFTLVGLVAVTGQPESALEPRLRGLVRREILELEADPRSPERGHYAFVQELIREVAYGTLAKRDRRARHLAVARHLEALGDDEVAGALAEHYLEAHRASAEGPEADAVAAQARIALRSAAERAAALGAHDQAVAFIEKALAVTPDPAEQAVLLQRAADSAEAAGRYGAAEGYARRAIAVQEATGDRLAAGRATARLASVLVTAGQIEPAITAIEAALATLPAGAAEEAEAALQGVLSRALFRSDENERSVLAADRALAIAERLNLDAVVAEALVNKASALSQLGRRREAAALLEGAIRVAETSGRVSTALRARHNLAVALGEDDPVRALEAEREGLDLAERVGDRSHAVPATAGIASYAAAVGGDLDWVLGLMEERLAGDLDPGDRATLTLLSAVIRANRGEDVGASLGELAAMTAGASDPLDLSAVPTLRAWVALAGGDSEQAISDALAAVEIAPRLVTEAYPVAIRAALWCGDLARAREVGALLDALPASGRVMQAARLTAWAGIAALEGRRADAISAYREALRRWREAGQLWDLALTAIDFATLLGPDEPDARAAAEEARPILERMRARPYLERLDAALAARATPERQPLSTEVAERR